MRLWMPTLLAATQLWGQGSVQMVEPDYGPDAETRPFTIEQVDVSLAVFKDGTPFGIVSHSAVLPDAVIQSLTRYRFPPAKEDLIFALRIPVRRYSDPPAKPDPSSRPVNAVRGNITHKVPPRYPEQARKARIQGRVVLSANIDKTGKIRDLIAVSGPKELYAEAVIAVRQWEYTPFLVNNQPVEVNTELEVSFVLR